MKKTIIVALLCFVVFSSIAMAEDTFRYGLTTNPRGMFNPILYTERYDGFIIDQVYDGCIKQNLCLLRQ